jgi:hypothetical protein
MRFSLQLGIWKILLKQGLDNLLLISLMRLVSNKEFNYRNLGYRSAVLSVRCLSDLFLILWAEEKCCSLHVKKSLLRWFNGILATIQQPNKIELSSD